jgi:hypothetical protein
VGNEDGKGEFSFGDMMRIKLKKRKKRRKRRKVWPTCVPSSRSSSEATPHSALPRGSARSGMG